MSLTYDRRSLNEDSEQVHACRCDTWNEEIKSVALTKEILMYFVRVNIIQIHDKKLKRILDDEGYHYFMGGDSWRWEFFMELMISGYSLLSTQD